MYITTNTIITAVSVIGAISTIMGLLFAVFSWINKQKEQEKDIRKMKEEQCLLTYGVLACLKGLKEQGCNGPVTEAIAKIEKHINKAAHEQEEN